MTHQVPGGIRRTALAPLPARAPMFAAAPRRAALAIGILIATKLALLLFYAWNSRFVMDEFGQLGYAKYLGNGLFDTIDPPKAVGFAVFMKLAHLIGWDAVSTLLAGRIQTAALACATLAVVFASARALGASKVRAFAVVLILLCFSNFIEQIFRTRGEQLAVFFAAAALLVLLRGRAADPRTIVVAGLLSGLAFLATQKSVYFNVALGAALLGDAALAGRTADGVRRGACLVLGWAVPVIVYCLVFGGSDPLSVAANLAFGPAEVASRGGAEYGGLRHFVLETLTRNAILYGFCFAGLALGLLRIRRQGEAHRIALIFTFIVTALVFAHDQPWPYVFVMALPFLALWSLDPFDALPSHRVYRGCAWAALAVAIVGSYARNSTYLALDNHRQRALLARAEAMLGPNEVYFDGIGMLPNRAEPSTLWLDRHFILATLSEGTHSEAYRIFSRMPPKLILWSYRMERIQPVVAPLIRDSYVHVAPNLRMAGRRLDRGTPIAFEVPVAGRYALYGGNGLPLGGRIELDGTPVDIPVALGRGRKSVTLRTGAASALLLPEGSYAGRIAAGRPDRALFDGVYD